MSIIEIEPWLSRWTRKAVFLPGAWRLLERIRRRSLDAHPRGVPHWTVIDDYDGTLKIKVDSCAYMGSLIYWLGYHSFNEVRLLGRMLRPEMNFADIGANQGEFTLFAAKRLTRGRVFAFEPVESMHRLLVENVAMNGFGNVTCFPFGLADRSGRVEVFTAEDHSVHGAFNEGLASMFRSGERARSLGRVEMRCLDEVVEEEGIGRLDVLKIDVEGAELPVLKGAQKLLGRDKPALVLEVSEPAFRAAGYSCRDLADFLHSFGYKVSLIKAFGRTAPLSGEAWPSFANILCQ